MVFKLKILTIMQNKTIEWSYIFCSMFEHEIE